MPSASSPPAARVLAVVVTYNRKELLVECLEALARQSHPLAGALVVDNASTDGTEELLVERGMSERMEIDYLRLARNGGGAEGFHYGVSHGAERDVDWIWLMDDDCEPADDSLAELLSSPRASDPATGALTPLVRTPEGDPLPLNRGWLRPRWFRSPIVGLAPSDYTRSETSIEFTSLVGPLVRTSIARELAPPRRDFFIWFDDLEYFSRLARVGALWLIPSSVIVHKDPRQLVGLGLRALWSEFATGYPLAQRWKRLYGLRNLIFCGRRDGYLTAGRAASFAFVSAVRALLFESHKARTLRLTVLYAGQGWRGVFRNVPPARWAEVVGERRPAAAIARESLRYDEPTDGPVRRLPAPVREASR